MRIMRIFAAGVLVAPAGAFAAPYYPNGDLGIYYDYSNQKIEQSLKPSGSGVGIGGTLNLPYNLFLDGRYQYNNEHTSEYDDFFGHEPGVSLQAEQARLGGGIQFFVPQAPVTVYGKIDYVHYGFDGRQAGVDLGSDNDDGAGYFLGFRTRYPGLNVYAQGGWLELSDTHGQEYTAGVDFPVGRTWPRGVPVKLFAEFQWSKLNEEQGGYHDIYYDYRAGLRVPI